MNKILLRQDKGQASSHLHSTKCTEHHNIYSGAQTKNSLPNQNKTARPTPGTSLLLIQRKIETNK